MAEKLGFTPSKDDDPNGYAFIVEFPKLTDYLSMYNKIKQITSVCIGLCFQINFHLFFRKGR